MLSPHRLMSVLALASLAAGSVSSGRDRRSEPLAFTGKEWRRRKSRLSLALASRKRNRR